MNYHQKYLNNRKNLMEGLKETFSKERLGELWWAIRGMEDNMKACVLIRDNFKCVRCSSEKRLTFHHKFIRVKPPTKEYSMKRHSMEMVETLCRDCHNKEHGLHVTADISYLPQNYIDKIKRSV